MSANKPLLGLQTGVVDGSENSLPNFYTQKFFEVQKYAALSYHGHDGYAVIVNKKFWDGLPADIRVTLDKAMQEATQYEHELKENDEAVAKIKAAGRIEVYELTSDERSALRRALLPVHKAMEGRIGKNWIDAVYKEAAALGYRY